MNTMQLLTQMLSMGNNSQQIIQNMAMQNPSVNVALNQMRQSGISPQEYVMRVAQQRGVDINQMINLLQQYGIR